MKQSQDCPDSPPPDKILIIKFRSIGDVVSMTPCLDALKNAYPSADIDVAVESPQNEILEFDPRVNELIILNKKSKKKFWQVPGDIRYIKRIRDKNYDLVIDLHGGPRSGWITFLSGSTRRVGSRLYRYRFPYTDILSPYREEPPAGRYHIVETQLGILEKIGINNPNPKTSIHVPGDADKWVSQTLNDNDIRPDKDKIFVVQPTATGYNKRWFPEKWSYYLNKLYELYKPKIIITTGPGEGGYAADVTKRVKFPYINMAEKTSLQTLAGLIKKSHLFIGCDSGPGHLAAAVGTPCIILFASTFYEIWAPWGEKVKIIREELECSPCGKRRCHTGTLDCIEKLHPDKVLEESIEFIEDVF